MDLYGIQAVQMIIELLYHTFKNQFYWWKVSIYIVEMILIHMILWITEVMHHDKTTHYQDGFTDVSKDTLLILTHFVRPITTFMNLAIVTMQFYEHYLYWKSGQKGRLLSSFRFLLHCVYTVICSMLVLINLGD